MTTGTGIFTQEQRDLLTAAYNRIIPAQDKFPGAGDLGGAQFVEQVAAKNIPLRRSFGEGLAQLEIAASQRGSEGFVGLSAEAQDETLRQVEAEHPVILPGTGKAVLQLLLHQPGSFRPDWLLHARPAGLPAFAL